MEDRLIPEVVQGGILEMSIDHIYKSSYSSKQVSKILLVNSNKKRVYSSVHSVYYLKPRVGIK